MFQDEARFGRMNEPERCWAPARIRPRVPRQQVREYTYAYAAVSPVDGVADFLILPTMTAEAMNLFLAEVARRHRSEGILMLYDGAGSHNPSALRIPSNVIVERLPPYCPELNPTESIWEEIREKFFANLMFDSLDAVETRLAEAMVHLEQHPDIVQSITGFEWIVDALKS